MSDTLKIRRNSAMELLAIAVVSLFPKARLVSGEVSTLGFYYDFFFPEPIGAEQIPIIEERMRDIIRQDFPIQVKEMMRKNAIELFKYHHQDLKVALLKANVETLVHVCQIGPFYDLGYPPFVETTKQIGIIKLLDLSHLKVSLPSKPNLTLTRLQGVVFPDQTSLKQFLKKAEAAKQRDHRLLGKQMHLFTTLEETCSGCWSWQPKGAILREILLDWWRSEHRQQKYQLIFTPNFVQAQLETQNRPKIQFEKEGPSYTACSIKAALHALIFKSKLHSYRDLPIRYCEYFESYDQGKEAHLWGLLRARSFTTDNSYIFCTSEQVSQELISSLQFISKTFKILGFESHWHLVSIHQSSKGISKKWKEAQESLVQALKGLGFDYTFDEENRTVYGPRLELHLTDALERKWRGPYIYLDLCHPEKLGLHYHGQDDKMHVPMMIGRSMFGSIERLIAILLEHYAGLLPLWLAPEQVRVLPVADKNVNYAIQICREIEMAGFRASSDTRKENLGARVHAAESEKIPYLVIVGDKEEKSKTLTYRKCLEEGMQEEVALRNFLEEVVKKLEFERF